MEEEGAQEMERTKRKQGKKRLKTKRKTEVDKVKTRRRKRIQRKATTKSDEKEANKWATAHCI